MKVRRCGGTPVEDTRDILANTVLAHVPVIHFNLKMKVRRGGGTPVEDTRDILANTVLAHVPFIHFNFKMKVRRGRGDPVDDTRDMLANTVLDPVPVVHFKLQDDGKEGGGAVALYTWLRTEGDRRVRPTDDHLNFNHGFTDWHSARSDDFMSVLKRGAA
jgi:hypothetical protein